MTQPKPKTLLERARALIEKHWGKGTWYSENNKTYCAIGAIQATGSRAKDPIQAAFSINTASQRAIPYLRKALPSGWDGNIIAFNDAPETTHKDVLAVYDRAIELASRG